MQDHLKNLEDYLKTDVIYEYYIKSKDKENYKEHLNDFEKFCLAHCEDIKWAIDELKALYELVKEMKK